MSETLPRPESEPPPDLPNGASGGRRPQVRGAGAPSAAAPGRRRPRVPAPLRWAAAILGLIVAAVAVFIALFQWNWLRGPIDGWASAALHRTVVIHGDLSGKLLTWTPSLTARDVTVAQPSWAGAGPMAKLPRLTIAVDLPALLGGRLILTRVEATQPWAHLLRSAAGNNNWTFAPPGAPPQPLKLPPIRTFVIDDGQLALDDAARNLHFTGRVSTNEQIVGFGRGSFSLNGQGSLNGAPFTALIQGGPLINVDPDRPYPFRSDIRAGATHIVAQGALQRPFDLGVFQAAGRVTGDDLARLYDLTGLTLPSSPPYDLTGEFSRTGERVEITHLSGRVGDSDLAGHLVVSEAGGRRDLTGQLASHRLKLADFTAFIGGAPRGALRGTVTSPAQQAEAARLTAEHRILPDARLDVTRLRQMDADVTYRAETVDAGPMPVRQVSLHLTLNRGLLTIDPLSLTLPQGALTGDLQLDARSDRPVTRVDLALARAQVQELLPQVLGRDPADGALAASVRLSGAGDSVREAAAHADGVVSVAMPGGQMRQLLAELMGIDVARSVFLYLAKDQSPTPIRCAVADFRAQGGLLTVQRLVIDTAAVQATGKGVIDLRDETLNLSISGKPKHFRLLRIAAPITLTGRLDDPKLGIDAGKALPQLGFGAVLGVVLAPAAAVLPFVAAGTVKDADCGALLDEARRLGAPIGH